MIFLCRSIGTDVEVLTSRYRNWNWGLPCGFLMELWLHSNFWLLIQRVIMTSACELLKLQCQGGNIDVGIRRVIDKKKFQLVLTSEFWCTNVRQLDGMTSGNSRFRRRGGHIGVVSLLTHYVVPISNSWCQKCQEGMVKLGRL